MLAWSGTKVEDSPDTILSKVYGGLEHWLLSRHLGCSWDKEVEALAAHHLTELVVEFQAENGVEGEPQRLGVQESMIERIPFRPEQHPSLSEFADANRVYLESLKRLVDAHVWGLDPRARAVN